MKQISYMGGIVTFGIPDHWMEEEKSEGGAMYYPPGRDFPTLRLNVITAKHKLKVDAQTVQDYFSQRAVKGAKIQVLKNGNVLMSSSEKSTEEGENLIIFFWELGNPVPPNHLRLAIFSLNFSAKEVSNGLLPKDYQWVEEEIGKAKFTSGIEYLQGNRK